LISRSDFDFRSWSRFVMLNVTCVQNLRSIERDLIGFRHQLCKFEVLKFIDFELRCDSSFRCCYVYFDTSCRSVLCYGTCWYVWAGPRGARAWFRLISGYFPSSFQCWCILVSGVTFLHRVASIVNA